MGDQAVGVFPHLEEVGLLLGGMDLAAADRALVLVHDLGGRIESLALLAVEALIVALVDVALVIELLEDLLDLGLVVGVRGPDEAVIGCVDQVPEPLDLPCDLIYELLGGLAGRQRAGLDLLSVLVAACLEIDVIAVCSLISRDRVRQDDLVGVADVRLA